MLYAVHLFLLSLVTSNVKAGSGVFTMTFSSMKIVYVDLCYTEWPSSAGKFLHSSCLFHPQPYSFTIHPGYQSKIGRPLRNILSDHIAVIINVTDSRGSHNSIRERFVVDGSLPNRSVTVAAQQLTVDFAIICESDYFGPRCARFCKTSPVNHQHFVCSSTGEKICLTGWTGEDCSIDDAEYNRVSSYFTRGKERSNMLPLRMYHSGMHTLMLGALMFSAMFVGYVLCAPNTQSAADLQIMYPFIYEAVSLLVVLFGTVIDATTNDRHDPCHPYACEYGECIAEGPSFRCKCLENYVGPTCNIWRSPSVNCDFRAPNACFNGGVCNITENSFRCVCPSNFTGFFCEEDVNECLMSPCENGATCINRIGDYYCVCPHGFKGATCKERIELCSAETCVNGGSCIDGTDGYICVCPPGYSGLRCEDAHNGIITEENDNELVNNCDECSHKDTNHPCDKNCGRPNCDSNRGDCILTASKPFDSCPSSSYCSQVFRNDVCDEVCNIEACMFDGFDCISKHLKCPDSISTYCKERKKDGVCNEPCNQEACDFDGGDCQQAVPNVLPGEIFVVVQAEPRYFIANVLHFLSLLSQMLRADVRIKNDEKGPMVFLWENGKTGERVTVEKQDVPTYLYKHPYSTDKRGVLAWIEVDVSRCVSECFSDIEVVASFIEAASTNLTDMSMSIYSAVARKPKSKGNWSLPVLVAITCTSFMIVFAIFFTVHERSRRRRKVIKNAPVWIPPTEFEAEKQGKYKRENGGELCSVLGNAKRRYVDLSELGLLEKPLALKPPRGTVLPKPPPSRLHIESASGKPISLRFSTEEANQRGPYGRTPLMIVARNTIKPEEQLIDDVRRLHDNGADMNLCDDYDDTALHMAVSSGHVALVRELLDFGASPVIRNGKNSTCLHLAARACTPDMIAALLEIEEMRKEVDAVDDDNRTALMLVAMHDRVDAKAAQMLIDAGAQVNYDGDKNLTSWRGRTALHFAAKYDNAQMVSFLVQKLACVDCQDYECCTPLHLAAEEGHIEPVKELIRAGASVSLRNDKFQTAYDVALINACHKVAALLASGDNIGVQLYSYHGEVFASSSSPKCKYAKLTFTSHEEASRHQISCGSPGVTYSTSAHDYPDNYSASSPYTHFTKPYSVSICGKSMPSPQFSSTVTKQKTSSGSTRQCVPNQETPASDISSPYFEGMRKCFAFSEELQEEPSGCFDSGFVTFTDASHYDHSAPCQPPYNGFLESVGTVNTSVDYSYALKDSKFN